MESLEHLAIGTLVSALVAGALWESYPATYLAALVPYGAALSVLVDLDHFLIARHRAGDWRHLRAVLAQPWNAVRGQEWIFADLVDVPRERLATHAIVTVALVGALSPIDPTLAAFSALILTAHVGCDLLRDAEVV